MSTICSVHPRKNIRIRDVGLSMVVDEKNNTDTADQKKQKKLNKKCVFRFAKDILLHDHASKKFGQIFKELRKDFKNEETYNQRNLEKCFDHIIEDILPTDAYTQQVDYMKHTKKTYNLSVKDWLERLSTMNEKLTWLSPSGGN